MINDLKKLEYYNEQNIEVDQKSSLTKQYESDLNFYLKNYVFRKVHVEDFEAFFSEKRLSAYLLSRKGSTADTVISNYIAFLYDKYDNNIFDANLKEKCLTNLENAKIRKKKELIDNFLSSEQLKYLMNEEYTIKILKPIDKELKIVTPIICGLAYYCNFGQSDIIDLTTSHIDLTANRIYNLHSYKNGTAKKWITISDAFAAKIKHYLEYRKKKCPESNRLFIDENRVCIDNSYVNKCFERLKRKKIIDVLKVPMNCQLIVRSSILQELEETEGDAMSDILYCFGVNIINENEYGLNKQLLHAVNEYYRRKQNIA